MPSGTPARRIATLGTYGDDHKKDFTVGRLHGLASRLLSLIKARLSEAIWLNCDILSFLAFYPLHQLPDAPPPPELPPPNELLDELEAAAAE